MQITNNQLKALLNAELSMSMVNFVDVLCVLEVICARWRVPANQQAAVISMMTTLPICANCIIACNGKAGAALQACMLACAAPSVTVGCTNGQSLASGATCKVKCAAGYISRGGSLFFSSLLGVCSRATLVCGVRCGALWNGNDGIVSAKTNETAGFYGCNKFGAPNGPCTLPQVLSVATAANPTAAVGALMGTAPACAACFAACSSKPAAQQSACGMACGPSTVKEDDWKTDAAELPGNRTCNVECGPGYVYESGTTQDICGVDYSKYEKATLKCTPADCALPSGAFGTGIVGTAAGNGCRPSQPLGHLRSCNVQCDSTYQFSSGSISYSCYAGKLTAPTLTCSGKPCTIPNLTLTDEVGYDDVFPDAARRRRAGCSMAEVLAVAAAPSAVTVVMGYLGSNPPCGQCLMGCASATGAAAQACAAACVDGGGDSSAAVTTAPTSKAPTNAPTIGTGQSGCKACKSGQALQPGECCATVCLGDWMKTARVYRCLPGRLITPQKSCEVRLPPKLGGEYSPPVDGIWQGGKGCADPQVAANVANASQTVAGETICLPNMLMLEGAVCHIACACGYGLDGFHNVDAQAYSKMSDQATYLAARYYRIGNRIISPTNWCTPRGCVLPRSGDKLLPNQLSLPSTLLPFGATYPVVVYGKLAGAPSICDPYYDNGLLKHGEKCEIQCQAGYFRQSGTNTYKCKAGVFVESPSMKCVPDICSRSLDGNKCFDWYATPSSLARHGFCFIVRGLAARTSCDKFAVAGCIRALRAALPASTTRAIRAFQA